MNRNLFRTAMLYCIQQESDGRFVLLNRDYKPIGFNMKNPCYYDEYPIQYKIIGLTPEVAASISHENNPSLISIYLYDDGSVPTDSKENMEMYLKRLALLMQLQVEGE